MSLLDLVQGRGSRLLDIGQGEFKRPPLPNAELLFIFSSSEMQTLSFLTKSLSHHHRHHHSRVAFLSKWHPRSRWHQPCVIKAAIRGRQQNKSRMPETPIQCVLDQATLELPYAMFGKASLIKQNMYKPIVC